MKKAVITAVALTLALCLAVGGTLAYLIDKTGEVKNTFTYGDVDITLAETGATNNAKEYKMVPGSILDKDPTVTVLAVSEACYVFVKVEKSPNLDTYIAYAMEEGWTLVDGETNVYYREVADTNDDQPFAVIGNKGEDGKGTFVANKVLVKSSVTKQQMEDIKDANQPTLTFTAYAIQSANLKVTEIAAIWNLAKTAQ